MSCYIASSNNRFFVAAESSFGTAAALAGRNRIPAVKLNARQELEKVRRQDKTGSRTWAGLPAGLRRRTVFGLSTYLTSWNDQTTEPVHGPLLSSSLGSSAQMFAGGTVASENGKQIGFSSAHGLTPGQAIAIGGEIRFVASVPDASHVIVNAPFAGAVQAGTTVLPTATYRPATKLPSATIGDYWSPDSAVHRLIAGAAVDEFIVKANGDFHGFEFKGAAADLIDSSSFESGAAGLSQFPAEPASPNFDYTIVPGNLGQVWLGSAPDRFFTLTSGEVKLVNNLDLRAKEFGSLLPRCIVAGIRDVTADLSIYANDEDQTKALYQAARQRSPIGLMLQLGEQPKQMCGVFLKSVVPEVPEFDDAEARLRWNFRSNRAQGVIDDEIIVAFA